MKKRWYETRGFLVGLICAMGMTAAMAAIPSKMPWDTIIFGKGDSTAAKQLEFNTGDSPNNVILGVDDSRNGSLNTNQLTIGDGTNTAQSLILDQGLGAGNVDISVDTSAQLSIDTDQITMGDGTAADQTLVFNRGGSNAFIEWNEANSRLELSNDGGAGSQIVTGTITTESSLLENITVDTSVGSSALTVALKQADGTTDLTAGSPGRTAFRDAVVADGAYNIQSVTGALSLVVPSGATLGHLDGVAEFLYVYELDNAGTVEMAISSAIKDESSVQTSQTIGTGSDDDDLYSATGRSNVPIRLVARLTSNQTTAGTWDADVTENSPGAQTFTALDTRITNKINKGGTVDELWKSCAFQYNCSGSASITNQNGNCIASIGNNSGNGACVLTFTDDVIEFFGCQVTMISADPNLNFGFHTFAPGSDQVTVDSEGSATGTDANPHAGSVVCHYE